MTAVKEQHARRRLEALRARLRPEVSSITEQTMAPSGGQAANEPSNAPFHMGDSGTNEFLHDLNAALLENEEYLTNEVQAALKRLDSGSYGRCESCGRSVAAARLEAIPYTRYCIKCAESATDAPDVNIDTGRPRWLEDTLSREGDANSPDLYGVDEPFAESMSNGESDRRGLRADTHAAGEPGGGGPNGGLAGSNAGHGDPNFGELEDAMGSGNFDVAEARDDDPDEPRSGRSGGAVGGTPAGKRARGS